MRALVTMTLIFVSLAFARFADAQEVDLKTKVARLLSGHHSLPAKAELDRLGPEVKVVLLELAIDAELFPLHRERARAALTYYPGAEVHTVYREILADPKATSLQKQRTLRFLARGFGEEALGELEPRLLDPDAQIRASAAAAIATLQSPRARRALERAAADPSPVVRAAARPPR